MGLFSGFVSLLHIDIDSAGKANIREEINLAHAVQAHINWKLRLQSYVDGTSDEQLEPAVIGCDDQCELGRWIRGPAMSHFHDLAPFHQLRADHADFHKFAGEVVRKVQANDLAAARTILEQDYSRISHKVVRALTELNKAVNE